jgi:threonyl-tRNA synthetase
VRVSTDYSDDWLNKKIRNAEQLHINYILVVWEQEEKEGTVSVRNYKTKEQSVEKLDSFKERVSKEYKERSL